MADVANKQGGLMISMSTLDMIVANDDDTLLQLG